MYIHYDIHHSQDDLATTHFEVLSVNVISYDVNWHSTLHSHDFAEIFYCLEGSGYIQTEYGQQPVQKNSFFLVNPYVVHTEYTSLEQPLKYIVIGFKGPEIILPNQAFDNGIHIVNDIANLYRPFFNMILNECENQGIYSSHMIDYIVNLLLLKLSNDANRHLSPHYDQPLSPSVNLAKHYIDNHYSNNITLDILEEKTHISRFHLSHLFKKELGISPINYLVNVRFTHAKILLETTNYSVLQISELIGFNSVNFFSTKFKEKFGQTPRDYRLQHRAS
ncbi:MAG: AraC family transcriptional regulator [Aerococcaceae bacterium]|nr:AraC family transcriptional regulator [Aerococcaceae bacterium]